MLKPIFIRCCFIALSVSLFACDKKTHTTDEPVAPIKAIQYLVVQAQTIEQQRRLSGYIRPVHLAELSFKVQGQLTKVEVQEGDSVIKGQVLAIVDNTPFKHKLAKATAELAGAKAGFKERSENYQRQKQIFERQLINTDAIDKAKADLEQAKSLVLLAKAQLSLSERDLDNTILRAPFSGIITRKEVDQFEEVNTRQVIMEIQDPTLFEVAFLVPGTLVGKLQQGDEVTINIPNANVSKQLAKVKKVGVGNNSRGAYPFSAQLEKPDKQLHSGMAADVFITIKDQNSGIVLPDSAVIIASNGDQQVYLFNAETQQVYPQKVSTQLLNVNQLLITSGLKPNDVVCTTGAEFLRKGQQVVLYQQRVDQ